MLTPYLGSKFVTKVLTSHTGEQFRVVFLVSLVNGEVRAQVVSAESIGGHKNEATALIDLGEVQKTAFQCLPISCSQATVEAGLSYGFVSQVSPFTSLLFFMSQPTRAPSL